MTRPGLQYTRNKGGLVSGLPYRQMAKHIRNIIEEEMADAGADGVLEAQNVVEEGGTGNRWTGAFRDRDGTVRSGPSAGRIASGHMYKALTFRLIRGKDVGLDVGWPGVWEKYFSAQDDGFDAPGYRNARQQVAGLGVIAHLRTYMRDRVDESLDRIEKRIVNGL